MRMRTRHVSGFDFMMAGRSGPRLTSGVFLNEEDAQKLQQGIDTISSILSTTSSSPPEDEANAVPGGNCDCQQLQVVHKISVHPSWGPSDPQPHQMLPGPSGVGMQCNRALQAVRNVREHLRGTRALNEQKANFAPYKLGKRRKMSALAPPPVKKCASWSTRFVCLANTDDDHVPCTVAQKEVLVEAGLGEQKVDIPDVDCSPKEFQEQLIKAFPKLKSSGGFELLRCVSNSKVLEPLSPSVSMSPKLLKSVVGKSRIFIRPIQRDLDLEAPDGDAAPKKQMDLKECCLKCGLELDISDLRHHVLNCGIFPMVNPTLKKEVIDVDQLSEERPAYEDFVPCHGVSGQPQEVEEEIVQVEEEIVRSVMEQSMHTANVSVSQTEVTSASISRTLAQEVDVFARDLDSKVPLHLDIRRSYVLFDAMREAKKKKFTTTKMVQVTFVGEGAVDYGGPRREFFRLLASEAAESFFIGNDFMKFFSMNATALQNNQYKYLGQYTVMSITQGGCGIPFLAPPVFDYISTGKLPDVKVHLKDIPDATLRFVLQKVGNAENNTEIQAVFAIDEVQSLVYEAGFRKPLAQVSMEDKSVVSLILVNYHCMTKVKAAMDQYMEGLESLGLLSRIQADPSKWKDFFVDTGVAVNSAYMKGVLTFQFSDEGSNLLPAEKTSIYKFCGLTG